MSIESAFMGNRPIVWAPNSPEDPTPTPAITTRRDRQAKFAAFIKDEIEACVNKVGRYGRLERIVVAEKIKVLSALRAVVLDPASNLRLLGDDVDFHVMLDGAYLVNLRAIIDIWIDKPVEDLEKVLNPDKQSTADSETIEWAAAWRNADEAAQKTVPPWYGNRCPLTGVETVDAAHIIDVQDVEGTRRDPMTLWHTLRISWPLDDIDYLEINETQNILPLSPTAHRLWDRNKFALRAIAHPSDPSHRMFLQVIWFEDHHADSGVSRTTRGKSGPAVTDLTDIRRLVINDEVEIAARFLRHGDVYELYTSDPTTRPLPDIYLFQVRYAVQQLLAGQQAPDALRDVFGGDPPDDVSMDDPVRDEAFMPRDWDDMLREAREHGILDESTSAVWRKSILERGFRKGLQIIWRARKLMKELGYLSDSDSDSDSDF